MEGARPRGRPKKTWRKTVLKDSQTRGLNGEDATDRIRWKKQNLSRTTQVSRHQKGKNQEGKTNLDLLEQETVSGSGI